MAVADSSAIIDFLMKDSTSFISWWNAFDVISNRGQKLVVTADRIVKRTKDFKTGRYSYLKGDFYVHHITRENGSMGADGIIFHRWPPKSEEYLEENDSFTVLREGLCKFAENELISMRVEDDDELT